MKDKYVPIMYDICEKIKTNPKLTLKDLAKTSNLSPTYLQKKFTAIIGISPKEYALNYQQNNFKNLLNQKTTSITNAIYTSGFASSSRIYEHSNKLLGMTPKEFKNKTYCEDIMLAVGQCSLGSVLVAQTNKGICAILLGDNPEKLLNDIQKSFPHAIFKGGDELFEHTVAQVIGLIDDPKTVVNLPLDIKGTAFQQKVWQVLKDIPLGTTLNYSEVAQKIGNPKSVRAVARACASNNIAILIPCHRVVRKNKDLAGYRWGIERKEKLLQKEASKL